MIELFLRYIFFTFLFLLLHLLFINIIYISINKIQENFINLEIKIPFHFLAEKYKNLILSTSQKYINFNTKEIIINNSKPLIKINNTIFFTEEIGIIENNYCYKNNIPLIHSNLPIYQMNATIIKKIIDIYFFLNKYFYGKLFHLIIKNDKEIEIQINKNIILSKFCIKKIKEVLLKQNEVKKT